MEEVGGYLKKVKGRIFLLMIFSYVIVGEFFKVVIVKYGRYFK